MGVDYKFLNFGVNIAKSLKRHGLKVNFSLINNVFLVRVFPLSMLQTILQKPLLLHIYIYIYIYIILQSLTYVRFCPVRQPALRINI
jgi:hypothetical protein